MRTPAPGPAVAVLSVALTIALALAAATATLAVRREIASERLYHRMVSHADDPAGTPLSRSAARTMVREYPDTKWASEAWRVLAIDAARRGDTGAEAEAWEGFGHVFGDAPLPGTALARLNLARIDEEAGRVDRAEEGYRDAVRIIRDGVGHEVQGWIAVEASIALSRLHAARNEPVVSARWKQRALAFEHPAPQTH